MEPELFLKVIFPLDVLATTLSVITVGVTTLPVKVAPVEVILSLSTSALSVNRKSASSGLACLALKIIPQLASEYITPALYPPPLPIVILPPPIISPAKVALPVLSNVIASVFVPSYSVVPILP